MLNNEINPIIGNLYNVRYKDSMRIALDKGGYYSNGFYYTQVLAYDFEPDNLFLIPLDSIVLYLGTYNNKNFGPYCLILWNKKIFKITSSTSFFEI